MSRTQGSVSLRLRLAIATTITGLAALAGLAAPQRAGADGARVVVEVEGLRSNRGAVLGALFRSRDGWTEEGREIATCRADIDGRTATCVLSDVAPGTYAFAFLHDEDGDGALDRDWIGLPSEGFGFSNDAAPVLGPPSFESASFRHAGSETDLHVRARYGL